MLLPYIGDEQDWEIEFSDYKRIQEFINYYKSNCKPHEDKIVLLNLIIASYDELLSIAHDENKLYWHEIETLLNSDLDIFKSTLVYWVVREDENYFNITPLIRHFIAENS